MGRAALYLVIGLIVVFFIHNYGGKALDWLDSKLRSNVKGRVLGPPATGLFDRLCPAGLWFTVKGFTS